MTIQEIITDVDDWPIERIEELAIRLNLLIAAKLPREEIDQAWKAEIRARVAEIESGGVALIDGEKVSAEVRKIVGR